MPTPQEIEMFLSSMGDDTLAKDLQRQIDAARELRNYQPEAASRLPGGGVVANVPGAIAGMFVRGNAVKDENKATAAQAAMAEKQRKIMAEYFNKVFGGQPQNGYGPQPFKDGGVV